MLVPQSIAPATKSALQDQQSSGPAKKPAAQGPQTTPRATKFAFQGPQSTAPATKSALQGPRSTAPATKSAFQGLQCTAPATKSALQVLRLPGFLKMSHMSKSHNSLHLSRSQSTYYYHHVQSAAPATKSTHPSRTARIPTTEARGFLGACHEK